MISTDFSGKVVLITGGGKGVGRGITERFLAAGANVVICGRNAPESLPACGERAAHFVTADIRQEEGLDALIAYVRQEFGRLDVLVNNAGGTPYALAADASSRYHDSIIRLNLLAPLLLSIKANALMQQQGGGVIVFIGSIGASTARPGSATYAAAKAGILSLTKSLAIEWAPKVRVVTVSPGLVETEKSELHYGDSDGIAAVAQTVPLQRMAQPADIGDACLFLASDHAGYISGVELLVNGGGERPAFLDVANVNKG